AAIEQRIGRKRFDLWFGSNTLLLPQGASLAVVAPSQFFLDWLRKNFRADIEAASQQVLGCIVPLHFALLTAQETDSTHGTGSSSSPPALDEAATAVATTAATVAMTEEAGPGRALTAAPNS